MNRDFIENSGGKYNPVSLTNTCQSTPVGGIFEGEEVTDARKTPPCKPIV